MPRCPPDCEVSARVYRYNRINEFVYFLHNVRRGGSDTVVVSCDSSLVVDAYGYLSVVKIDSAIEQEPKS